MITTNSLEVMIKSLPDLGATHTFKIASPATVCFAPRSLKNTLFFGLSSTAGFGQASGSI